MSPLPHDPQQPVTAADIDTWRHAAQLKRLDLHTQAAAPWNSLERHEAFAGMSALLQQALEELRMASEAVREGGQHVRRKAADLRQHSDQLRERSAVLQARMAQLVPPLPEEVRDAESQRQAMFRDDTPRA